MICSSRRMPLLSALVLVASGTALQAVTIQNGTIQGDLSANLSLTLPTQDTVELEAFTLPSNGTVTVASTSFASGGFQPNLSLFDSNGNFVQGNVIPGSSGLAQPDANGNKFDAYLEANGLVAGNYTLAISDWQVTQSPTATNLSDGFTDYGSPSSFVDEMGNARTGDFAASVDAAATPEPSTLGLVALVMVGAGVLTRKRLFSRTSGKISV